MKNKKITIGRLIIIVLIILLVVIGGTYAWFTYKSRETALVLSIGNNNNSRVIIKPYEIRDTITPVNTYTSGVYSQIQAINNNSSNTMSIVLYYRINQLDETLINNGLKYTIVSSNTLNGQYTEVKTGDFKELYEENELIILNDSISSNTTMYYKVYLWLDSSIGEQSLVQSLSIDIELNGKVWLNAMAPVLDNGMIPVIISDTGIVTTTFFNDINWYNYQEQKWANAVLVSDSSRQSYVNTRNVVVDPSDILAYYVWIPRYKYKIWTTSISSAGQEQPIDILFESKDDAMSEGTAVGEYRTHPAFWWDDNNDGVVSNDELLPGIWVGKFETTGTKTAPKILPNVSSLRNINVSTMFNTAFLFSSDVTYGLSGALDSHMMKVSEWGAVAYLSHSIYGINKEVRVNNYYSSNTKTGCGASSANAATATSCQIAYGTPSSEENKYPQSTTGNITGIFDMSGGAHDVLMGGYKKTIRNSGFTTATFPESKYYNNYTFTAISSCTTLTCGGHTMFETYNWYSDNKVDFSSDYPWYTAGGKYDGKTAAGTFAMTRFSGTSSDSYGFRSVLIPKSNYVVTFDANGGSLSSVEKEIYYGSAYGELPTPTREHFTFLGWYTKQSGGIKVTSGTIVSIRGNHTLYAHWQENPYYLITYDANGGTGAPSSQKKYESVSSITLSNTIPTRTGYSFLGWSTNKSATQPDYNPGYEYSANSSVTLYALWRYVGVLSCSLSASGTTITANMTSSEQLTYYGWDSSYTGQNSDTTTITATGTFTFYLMNELNNRASCSGTVTATTKEQYCSCGQSHAGACYNIQGGQYVYCGNYSYRYVCDTDAGYSKLNNSYCWKAG